LCQRYFAKTFPQGVAVAQNAGFQNSVSSDYAYTNGAGAVANWFFPVVMRASPTVTSYNPRQANSNWRNQTDTADANRNFNSAGGNGDSNISVRGDTNTVAGAVYYIHLTAEIEL
jgi:hypothetical protein